MQEGLKSAIQESGHKLHLKVAEFLKNSGWEVDLSLYYYDDITYKPREIDIVAKKEVFYKDLSRDSFFVFLVVECKHIKNEVCFRILDNSIEAVKRSLFAQSRNLTGILKHLEKSKEHHYFNEEKIAKLYDVAKEDNKNREQDFFSEAIVRPIKSLIYLKGSEEHKAIYYPIVIFEGAKIYLLDKESRNKNDLLDKLPASERVTFGLLYAYRPNPGGIGLTTARTDNFFIDFVHLDKLDDYLKIIDNEVNEIKRCLKSRDKE